MNDPSVYISHSSNFFIACHMADTGCMYSFRLATRSMVDPNATDSGDVPGDRRGGFMGLWRWG